MSGRERLHVDHSGKRWARRLGSIATVTALGLSMAAPAEACSPEPNCRDFVMPVAMAQGAPKDQRIDVTYCQPQLHGQGGRSSKHRKVIVDTPGAGYNKTYYDWPQDPNKYSYTRAALKDGISVVNYTPVGRVGGKSTDPSVGRVGGKSTHPESTSVTIQSDAFVLSQLIDLVHKWGYDDVTSMGHSQGSGVALRNAATNHNVQRLILTGYLNTARNPQVLANNYSANLDPSFQNLALDPGYLTSKPGLRSEFYSEAADPEVIKYDDKTRDVISATALGGYAVDQAASPANSLARGVDVPVLFVTGEDDIIFCQDPRYACSDRRAILNLERTYFVNSPNIDYDSVAHTGHDLATATTASRTAAAIDAWVSAPSMAR
ncbi:MAG TPA: alpha/beta hydrolase [Patescibacteria group bacterium]|nr:alpha/beta hydrolase [Patescibacteria group bacterium]